MTVAVWPSDLPRPLRSGWQRQAMDPRRQRINETGPVSRSRRYSSVSELVTLTMRLDRVQRDIFDRFVERTLAHGSLPFWMPDPATDGWPLLTPEGVPLLTPQGVPLLATRQWLCQMGDEMPVEGPVQGVHFNAAFAVRVLP